ncbi:MAG: carbohydrate-binding family 9-like protein, partial [Planctomycetes bacterium]|nr:carbohydrate-binding family 9-like protein [Planctomycetota bacterium]
MILLSFWFLGGDPAPRPGPAGDYCPKSYVCRRAGQPLKIDGLLEEAAWRKAAWTDDFQDIQGADLPAPAYRTRAKMLWDDEYFYVAAELEEPHIWANLTERDSVIFQDNDFEIFIDPDGDTHHYYEFEMNALNTVWDLFLDKPYRDKAKPLFCWDIGGLKTGVHVEGTINDPSDRDRHWTVEAAFPWKVLQECAPGNRRPGHGDQWRINFSRVEWRVEVKAGRYQKVIDPETDKPFPEDNWVWSPQGEINMHMPELWGFVQFSEKEVGSTERDAFIPNREERMKWALRQVYYREKA